MSHASQLPLQEVFLFSLGWQYSSHFQIPKAPHLFLSHDMCDGFCYIFHIFAAFIAVLNPAAPPWSLADIGHGQWLPQPNRTWAGLTCYFCEKALRSSTWCGHGANMSQEGLHLLPDSRKVNRNAADLWMTLPDKVCWEPPRVCGCSIKMFSFRRWFIKEISYSTWNDQCLYMCLFYLIRV